MKVKCYAKINLSLNVLQKRPDGYHDVDMVMQAVNLYDMLEIELVKQHGIYLTCNDNSLPVDGTNLAYRAAEIFLKSTGIEKAGVKLHLDKNIPVGAGLAGGSSDAAGVLWGLNILYDTPFLPEKLAELGAKLGADVPFCVMAQPNAGYGTCYHAEGIGEILSHIPHLLPWHCVIVKPRAFISTAKAYSLLKLDMVEKRPDTFMVIEGIAEKNIQKIAQNTANVFESAIVPLNPQIAEIKSGLTRCGAAFSLMSGSGSAVFGVFENFHVAQAAHDKMKKITDEVFLCNFI